MPLAPGFGFAFRNDGTRIRVFRLFMECCAADARPLSIPVDFGKAPPDYKEMGWYKIRGKMDYRMEDGITVPILRAIGMAETEEPEEGMLY